MLLDSFQFIEPLQCTVMPFIESPVLDNRNVVAIEFLSSIVECLDGPREDGSIANIELISILLQRLACLDGLLNSCIIS